MRKGILVVLGTASLFFWVTKIQGEEFRFKPAINLGPLINTEWREADPFVTPDGQKLFFVSDRLTHSDMDIYMSLWTGSDWGAPVSVGPNVNSGLDEWSPSLSPDATMLYFTAYGRPGSYGGWDMWMCPWDSALQQWGPAQNLGPVINSPSTDWFGKISYSGQSLYYASNGKGCNYCRPLLVSRWDGTSWSTPEAFPYYINNTGTEERPSLTADENIMYFVRWNYFQEIYVTERVPSYSNNWSEPVKLDSFINFNGQFGTSGPCITPNGTKLYFSSWRQGGFGQDDIWAAERIIPVIFGDLNLDGRITIADVMLELNKVFLGEPFPAEPEMGDLNCDGQFTPADAVLLLNRVFLETPLPCAFTSDTNLVNLG